MFFKKKKKVRIKKSRIEIRFFKELKSMEVTFFDPSVKYKMSGLKINLGSAYADFQEIGGSNKLTFSSVGISRNDTLTLLYVKILTKLSKASKDALIEKLI